MRSKIKLIPTLIFVVIASVVFSSIHMRYSADIVAQSTGYFISLGILPALIGGLFGVFGAFILGKEINQGIKKFWWVPLVGSIASIAPIGYVLLVMSLPNH